MHTQRRYATCLGMSKKREKIAPYPKRKEKERRFIQRSSYTIHPKYPHNCTSWSRFMTYFSFVSGFWLSKIWEASLPSYPPYLQLHKKKPLEVGWKRKAHKRPWWGIKHLERSESIKWGAKQRFVLKINKKNPKLLDIRSWGDLTQDRSTPQLPEMAW